jgi:hypothetical protein
MDERAQNYIQEMTARTYLSEDPVLELIESHKRQRQIVREETEKGLRAHQRLWFLPLRLRLWLQGY